MATSFLEDPARDLYADFQDFSSVSSSPIDNGEYHSPVPPAHDGWSELSADDSSTTASPLHYTSSGTDFSPIAIPSAPQDEQPVVQAPPRGKKRVVKKKATSRAAATPPAAVVIAVQPANAEITSVVDGMTVESTDPSYLVPGEPSIVLPDAAGSDSLLDATGELGAQATADYDQMSVEEKPKKKRTKKRSKPDYDDTEVARVRLSRDALLSVTSDELENFAATAAAERPLTTEESREVKRQRRLIKNREYAQMSRGKKKVYMQELETKFNDIENENFELKKTVQDLTVRVTQLETEKSDLQNKLAYYETSIPPVRNSTPFFNKPESAFPSMDIDETKTQPSLSGFLSDILTIDSAQPANIPSMGLGGKAVTTVNAGICILAIFFSFAVYFSPHLLVQGGSFDQAAGFVGASAQTWASQVHRKLNDYINDPTMHTIEDFVSYMPAVSTGKTQHDPSPPIEQEVAKALEVPAVDQYTLRHIPVPEPAKVITMDDVMNAEDTRYGVMEEESVGPRYPVDDALDLDTPTFTEAKQREEIERAARDAEESRQRAARQAEEAERKAREMEAARLAEEARQHQEKQRLAEEARQLEIAAQQEADRKAEEARQEKLAEETRQRETAAAQAEAERLAQEAEAQRDIAKQEELRRLQEENLAQETRQREAERIAREAYEASLQELTEPGVQTTEPVEHIETVEPSTPTPEPVAEGDPSETLRQLQKDQEELARLLEKHNEQQNQ